MAPSPSLRRRSGSGAILGFAVIGVVVLSIMVLSQGYLQGAISQADAILAGRQAEYLADGAMAEALYRLQVERNGAYQGMFMGGGSASITPSTAQGITAGGVTVGDVDVTIESAADIQGDGRGYAGRVVLGAAAFVPRRVARVLGTGVSRSVVSAHEYRAVQQGPPEPFAQWPLYVNRLRDLREVERWYIEEVQEEWKRVREDTQAQVEMDARDIVSAFTPYQAFAGQVNTYTQAWFDWPPTLPAVLGEFPLSPYVSVSWRWGPVSGSADVKKIRLKLTANGDAEVTNGPFGLGNGWKNNRDEIPEMLPIIEEAVREGIETVVENVYWEALTVEDFLTRTAELRDADAAGFPGRVSAGPGQYQLQPLTWRDFREDNADLMSPAHFEQSPLTADDLLLKAPDHNQLVKPVFPDSPIRMIKDAGFPLSFDGQRWDEALMDSPPLAEMNFAFEDFKTLWTEAFPDYQDEWEKELQRYEDLILLQTSAPEDLARPPYWRAFASYRFPDAGTMASYIAARWGSACSVYDYPGGAAPAGLAGDATFVADGDVSVSGSGGGVKNYVSGAGMSISGAARGAFMALESPLDFGGATVTGTVVTKGLRNGGPEELEPFTIEHDALAEAGITVSISEYPVMVAMSRGR